MIWRLAASSSCSFGQSPASRRAENLSYLQETIDELSTNIFAVLLKDLGTKERVAASSQVIVRG